VPQGQNDSAPTGQPVKSSHVIEEHIDVGVPRDVAYDQWTQYRELGQYSKKESAEQRRDDRIAFTSKIGPSSRRWDAEVVEQVPGKRIAWRSVGGARNMGVRAKAEMERASELTSSIGTMVGLVTTAVEVTSALRGQEATAAENPRATPRMRFSARTRTSVGTRTRTSVGTRTRTSVRRRMMTTKRGRDSAVQADQLRSRYVSMLLDQLSETRYPSSPMLDRIEAALTDPHAAEDYVGRLLGTAEQDRYPSPVMLQRLDRLIAKLESLSA
jgi:hypothetical protein